MSRAQDVLDYWKSIGPGGWWKKNDEIDQQIAKQFGGLHGDAAKGKLKSWLAEPDSALAHVIILDQFSRNMFRGDARTFAYDEMACKMARDAIGKGFDRQSDPDLSGFFYLPLMHAESLRDQQECVLLMHRKGEEGGIRSAIEHHDIIKRFARFPHRNDVLGRHTTPAEKAFLDAGGFKG